MQPGLEGAIKNSLGEEKPLVEVEGDESSDSSSEGSEKPKQTVFDSPVVVDAAVLKREATNWDYESIRRLHLLYDGLIENADNLGMFNADIFRKWKNFLGKQDDTRRVEIRDLFKAMDERRRGFVKGDYLGTHKEAVSKIVGSSGQFQELVGMVERQYGESKMTEAVFTKMMLEFVNKRMTE